MAAVNVHSDFGAQENKVFTVSTLSPSICHAFMGLNVMILLFFERWVLSQTSHFPLSPSSTGSLVPLCFLPFGWCHLHIWGYWYFSWQSWFQLEIHPARHFIWCILNNLNKQGDSIQSWHTRFPILVYSGGSAGKNICLQCGRLGFNPWVGKIPWRREQLPTPVFQPGEFHGVYGVTKSRTRLSGFHFPNFEPVCCSMSGSSWCVLTCYRFLRRQIRWSGISILWRIFHSFSWSTESKALA